MCPQGTAWHPQQALGAGEYQGVVELWNILSWRGPTGIRVQGDSAQTPRNPTLHPWERCPNAPGALGHSRGASGEENLSLKSNFPLPWDSSGRSLRRSLHQHRQYPLPGHPTRHKQSLTHITREKRNPKRRNPALGGASFTLQFPGVCLEIPERRQRTQHEINPGKSKGKGLSSSPGI